MKNCWKTVACCLSVLALSACGGDEAETPTPVTGDTARAPAAPAASATPAGGAGVTEDGVPQFFVEGAEKVEVQEISVNQNVDASKFGNRPWQAIRSPQHLQQIWQELGITTPPPAVNFDSQSLLIMRVPEGGNAFFYQSADAFKIAVTGEGDGGALRFYVTPKLPNRIDSIRPGPPAAAGARAPRSGGAEPTSQPGAPPAAPR